MRTNDRNPRPVGRVAGALAAAVFAAALLSACGVSGSDDATTTTDPESADTTAPGTDTSAPGPSGVVLSVEDLETVLPEADEVGFGFEEVPADDEEGNSAAADAMSEACPETADFVNDDDEGGDTAFRAFAADDGRSFTVELNPEPRDVGADYVADMIDAVNGCDGFSFTSDGAEYTVTMSAEPADEIGDMGVLINQDITLVHPSLDGPVSFSQSNLNILDGTVGIELFSADGIASDGSVTPADTEVMADVAMTISSELQPLLED